MARLGPCAIAVSLLAQFRWPVVSQDRPFVLAASQTIRHKYCGFAREVKRSEVWIAHSGTPWPTGLSIPAVPRSVLHVRLFGTHRWRERAGTLCIARPFFHRVLLKRFHARTSDMF